MEKRKLPCGAPDEESESDSWKNEIGCTIIGCEKCKYFTGMIYYEANAAKALSLWAKHEIGVGKNGVL